MFFYANVYGYNNSTLSCQPVSVLVPTLRDGYTQQILYAKNSNDQSCNISNVISKNIINIKVLTKFINNRLMRSSMTPRSVRAIAEAKQHWSVIGWVTNKLIISSSYVLRASFEVVSTHQSALGPRNFCYFVILSSPTLESGSVSWEY
jgi:hypothetical protein